MMSEATRHIEKGQALLLFDWNYIQNSGLGTMSRILV